MNWLSLLEENALIIDMIAKLDAISHIYSSDHTHFFYGIWFIQIFQRCSEWKFCWSFPLRWQLSNLCSHWQRKDRPVRAMYPKASREIFDDRRSLQACFWCSKSCKDRWVFALCSGCYNSDLTVAHGVQIGTSLSHSINVWSISFLIFSCRCPSAAVYRK